MPLLSQATENIVRTLAAKNEGPFYFYSLEKIRSQAALLRDRLGENVSLYYSLKANSRAEILRVMKSESLKADVASAGEMREALQAGFAAADLSFTGPGKQDWEIRDAIGAGIGTLIVESIGEILLIEEIAQSLGVDARVSFRLTPSKKVNHVGRLQENLSTQFGFSRSEWSELFNTLSELKRVHVVGTHSHLQSQMLSSEVALKNVEFAIEESEEFRSAYSSFALKEIEFEQICVGGGFGIPYSESAQPFMLDSFAFDFNRHKSAYLKTHPRTRLAFEFGRYLVGESGVFVAKILFVKKDIGSPNGLFAIANGGFAQCQIACGAGQVVRTNLPLTLLKVNGGRRSKGSTIVSVAGPTCYSQDVLARNLSLDGVASGDLICIHNVGAYGKQFSPNEFLRQPFAPEFFEGS
jgi:diaminopimelate decarboxylase